MKANIKIKQSNLIMCIYIIFMIFPGYIQHTSLNLTWRICQLLSFVVCFVYMLLRIKKYKTNRFIACSIIYYCYIVLITIIRNHEAFSITTLLSYLMIIFLILIIDYCFSRDFNVSLNILYNIFAIILFLDILSIVIFRDGLYKVQFSWSEAWSYSLFPGWFLGTKNDHGTYFLIFLLLSYMKYEKKPIKRLKFRIVIFFIVSAISMLLVESITSFVAILIASIGLIVSFRNADNKKGFIKTKFLLIGFCVINVAIIGGQTLFILPSLTSSLNRDISFSGRTTIWGTVLKYISSQPIFGSGLISYDAASSMLGGGMRTHAHNDILNTLWVGGIVLLVIVLFTMYYMIVGLENQHRKSQFIILGIILGAMVIMTFESSLTWNRTWILFLLCYEMCVYSGEKMNPIMKMKSNKENC